MINRQIPAPISEGSPYIPVITYTMDWPMVMIMPNTRNQKKAVLRVGHPTVLEEPLTRQQLRAGHWENKGEHD